ncbi:GIY-YIG nuclease family protein [Paenibacillus sp. MMO-58]|uniref:GIY-YIG nuclease family protein n=1 Tax=Paenibacillus sp. MMO-58 TaxID=3081290 RepID=UPI00301ADD95
MIQSIMKKFEGNIFDPRNDDPKQLPNVKGLYMITAGSEDHLPECMRGLKYSRLLDRLIIYIGISNKSLRARDYRQHFNGNARGSTLRKSLGSLMQLTKLRADQFPSKYKFEKEDEAKLSRWMRDNLFLHYCASESPDDIEKVLIRDFNPPLNLKDNNSEANLDFRRLLKELRK